MRRSTRKDRLARAYNLLLSEFGALGWWPAKTRFEVMVGAILTQSTSWSNVEKALGNLRREGLLTPERLRAVGERKLARLVRPSLYYNAKAKKLKAFTDFMYRKYGGDLRLMKKERTEDLRVKLLGVWGIGPETADSILLYALDKPSFVVDAYTARLLGRLGLIEGDESYDEVKALLEGSVDRDIGTYKEYHALIVEQCKRVCLKNKPKCGECCLRKKCGFISSA